MFRNHALHVVRILNWAIKLLPYAYVQAHSVSYPERDYLVFAVNQALIWVVRWYVGWLHRGSSYLLVRVVNDGHNSLQYR